MDAFARELEAKGAEAAKAAAADGQTAAPAAPCREERSAAPAVPTPGLDEGPQEVPEDGAGTEASTPKGTQ